MKAIIKNIDEDSFVEDENHSDFFAKAMTWHIGEEIEVSQKHDNWFIGKPKNSMSPFFWHRDWLEFKD